MRPMSPPRSLDRSRDDAPHSEGQAGIRVGRVVAGFAVGVAAVFAGVYLSLPWIAERVIVGTLKDSGFPAASLRVAELGVTDIMLTDLTLGPGVTARRVKVRYSPGRIVNGSIDGIELEAPTLPIGIGAGGLDYGVLSPLADASGGTGGGVRILGPVRVKDGALELATPFGSVQARLDGEVLFTDGLGTKIDAAVGLTHPAAKMSTRVKGTLSDSGVVAVDVVVDDAESTAELAFATMTGTLHVGGTPPRSLDGAGTLTMRGVRVKDVAIGNVDVSGTVTDTRAAIDLVLGGDGTGLSVHATVQADDILDPAAAIRINGDAATDGLKGPAGLPGALDAVGAVDFDFLGARRDLQALLGAMGGQTVQVRSPVRGRITADQLSVALPDGAFDMTLNGALDAEVAGGGWRLSAAEPLDLDAGGVIGGVRRTLSAALAPVPGQDVLEGGLDRAKPITAAFRMDGEIDGAYPLRGDVGGTLRLDAAKGLLVEDLALTLDARPIRIGKVDLSVENASVHLSGVPGDLALDVAAAAGVNGPIAGVQVVGGRFDVRSRIDIDADGLRAFPPGCADLRAATLRQNDLVLRPQPMKLCPPADGGAMLTAKIENGALKRIEGAGVLGSTEIVADGLLPQPLSGTLPRVEAQGTYDPARDTWWLRLNAAGGALRAEGPDIALADVAAKGEVTGLGTRVVGARLPSFAVKLVDHRRPLRLAPLEVAGRVEIQGQVARFDGALTGKGGLSGKLQAEHRMDNGQGRATVTVPEWRFAAGAQPTETVPLLKGIVIDVAGGIAAEAHADWTRARTRSSASIDVKDLAFATTAAQFAGVAGKIELTDLGTPTSDGGQTLTLGLVDAGLPLIDGTALFSLPGDGTVHVKKVAWPFAGGSISMTDAVVPLDKRPSGMTVDIVGVDAASLVRMTEVDDLSAEGMLAGRVPVVFDVDGPSLKDAKLRAVGGGLIRYRAQAAAQALKQSGGSAELLAQALENFRFTDLDMTLNGPLDGEIAARAEIKGANPDLYDGKRIELNVNLSGVLRDLLRSVSLFNELPASIRDRVQGSSGHRP